MSWYIVYTTIREIMPKIQRTFGGQCLYINIYIYISGYKHWNVTYTHLQLHTLHINYVLSTAAQDSANLFLAWLLPAKNRLNLQSRWLVAGMIWLIILLDLYVYHSSKKLLWQDYVFPTVMVTSSVCLLNPVILHSVISFLTSRRRNCNV